MHADKGLTPLMRQYFDIKNKYPDTLLLFQVGDFYEIFFEDAHKAAAVLGIALTQRGTHKGEPIPLCGVPLHVVDHYLTKLVKAGFKVALCDQLEIPRPGKVVDRGVTQVLTPGTLTDSKLLDEKSASYLCVFFPTETSWTLLFAELLTGQLFMTIVTESSTTLLEAELARFMPDEIVLPQTKLGGIYAQLFQRQGFAVSYEQFSTHGTQEAEQWFRQQFTHTPFSLAAGDGMSFALTILYTYLKRNNEQGLFQLKQFSFYKPEDYLMLDAATQRNLELVKNTQDGSSASTLFSVLDRAVTAMGSRMIKKWLLRPLIKKEHIEERLQAVELLVKDHARKNELQKLMQSVGDCERIIGRIALKRAQLYDYLALLTALRVIPAVKAVIVESPSPLLRSIAEKIGDFKQLETLLEAALNDDSGKEWVVKRGFNEELDRLRTLVEGSAQALVTLEAQEQQRTGISSLKIRYNVHGYGIEVTNPNLSLVPSHYLRTQTLANRERFTTQELKDLERDLMRAQSEISQKEKEVFEKIKDQVEHQVASLKRLSYALAYADALTALAECAYTNKYVRPAFTDDHSIIITEGRHPVVEARLRSSFIPNGVELTDEASLWLITGPNMGGKSTFLRQVALITLMAQMGSFVPAASARLSIVDRIFTRIGAADNVAEGKSTFLVEMEETALICTQATKQSLVILDEVGRGTSTFDGLAIAQAVVEYIYTHIQARCLFATHYHELTDLCTVFSGIRPYYAASTKTVEGIILLHKILAGVADGSFGIEVAKSARLPESVIKRAREILQKHSHTGLPRRANIKQYEPEPQQQTPITLIAAELSSIDCEHLTPKQALDLLWRFKELVK